MRFSGRGAAAMGIFLGAQLLSVASLAHIRLNAPSPRSDADNLKSGPCGGVAKGAVKTTYAQGATVEVNLQETIGHRGCFQIALSRDDDQSFTVLAQADDPADGSGARTVSVTLPADVACGNCTLQARQLMVGRACAPNEDIAQLGAGDVYYSCADVEIEARAGASSSGGSSGGGSSSGGPDMGTSGTVVAPPVGSGSSGSGAGAAPPAEGGRRAGSDLDDGGCSAGGTSASASAALLVWATSWLVRARRGRRR